MAKKRYSEEFRRDAVERARRASLEGRSVGRVALEVGVHPHTLRSWLLADDAEHAGSGKNTSGLTLAEELAQVKKENRLLKAERDLLKKAAVLFARDDS